MSDTKLRDLERRWKETGTVEDEAAYLLERVRVGDLSHQRLQLGAALGYPAILRALHLPPLEPPMDALAETLSNWGAPPLVIAVAAVVERGLLPFEQRYQGYPEDRSARAAVMAAVEWAWCPCHQHGEKARSAASLSRSDSKSPPSPS